MSFYITWGIVFAIGAVWSAVVYLPKVPAKGWVYAGEGFTTGLMFAFLFGCAAAFVVGAL